MIVGLVFGKRLDAVQNAPDFDLESVFGRCQDLIKVLDHLLAADPATGLADEAPALQNRLNRFTPCGFEPNLDYVRVQILAISDGQEIIGRVGDALAQTEPGRVKKLIPRVRITTE